MEKKRKLPARAAARAEQAAKRRNTTPPQRSATPASAAPEPEPTPVEDVPPPLPKSITTGKPLPTVDSPQPGDLSLSEYQSVTESGVLAESLLRSRQKWISEGIFEKYWSKPTKRKGVVIEEPNNPPKESMAKLGQVTITVEPHVFEATMYAVKDPKPPPPPNTERPVIQYGPPNGVMPPPPTPGSATPTNASTPSQIPAPEAPVPLEQNTPTQMQTHTQTRTPTLPAAQPAVEKPVPDVSRSTPAVPIPVPRPPAASPRGMESVLLPTTTTPLIPQSPGVQPQQPRPTPPPTYAVPVSTPAGFAAAGPGPAGANTTLINPAGNSTPATPSTPAAGKPAPGTDPIILTLAERATGDPELRDLMKRVAQGEAKKQELEKFQAVIEAITVESKRKGSMAGPSADRILVDGRKVRYFSDEVRAILDIVLSSNPKQTSADLRPPAGSDPLVVLLVKAALDNIKTRDMVRRIAENKPEFSDATDLQAILERLRTKLVRDKDPQQQQQQQHVQPPVPASPVIPHKSKPTPNGHAPSSTPHPPAPQQALRSKGPPPPPPKPDISAIVFEFTGGTGDRYLFPKFSLLEYMPLPAGQAGQQVIASFLLVRRGSRAEYPVADPDLDYYQPLTVRLFTHAGRHLEHLARVVAPPDEVRRYMDGVMRGMTRAEYVLLAMRLPRGEPGEGGEDRGVNGGTVVRDKDKEGGNAAPPLPGGVLWTTKMPKPEIRDLPPRSKMYGRVMDADEQYQSFIASVSRTEEV
ncbi:hypothetical protein BT67DRAFT_406343 [Trichocladium antarcticum]|uniref:SWR1-complex protein 3 domain-containing protein n=1 Tax=Trichocladium antarcticum TaxID=1450529 RepID=A0AAN6UGS3_9PEZI|nr:hypothetical protein BT67DRAFT_406343 [Trichocladium antarcticum]